MVRGIKMSNNTVLQERLITYFNKLNKPMRVGKLFKIFKIKEYQKAEFNNLLNSLKDAQIIKIEKGTIIPPHYIEQSNHFFLFCFAKKASKS